MRFSRNVPRTFLAASSLLAAIAACDGERLRPGPPELILTGPESGTVFSPDTITVGIHAADASGLDSVAIGYLGQFASLANTFSATSVDDIAIFYIPDGLSPGQMAIITATAADLSGQQTTQTLSLTVVPRP